MKKILTITVDVEGRSVSRKYFLGESTEEYLGEALQEMVEVASEISNRDTF